MKTVVIISYECFNVRCCVDENGTILQEYPLVWYYNGMNLTDEITNWIDKNNLPHWADWTEEEKILFKITWC